MDCLSIALSLPAGQCLVLMDERAGRAIAKELGIRVAGTAAVIGFAKQQGLIASAKDSFARLHASDFRISKEVIQAVLSQAGEV
jgi:predicted nucleic acid-binding protein